MEIEKIIYDTTRDLLNLEDKLSIAAIFIFCWKMNDKAFAELLYCQDRGRLIEKLNAEYSADFTIKLSDKNTRECFYKTLDRVKEKYDADKYYKALFDGDPFAVAIYEICNTKFEAA
jgi:hypothetical protein